jgi:hypothetical protein
LTKSYFSVKLSARMINQFFRLKYNEFQMKKIPHSNIYKYRVFSALPRITIIGLIAAIDRCAGILIHEKDSISSQLRMGKKTQSYLVLWGLIPQSYAGGDIVTREIGNFYIGIAQDINNVPMNFGGITP